jgi:hypothetical protein
LCVKTANNDVIWRVCQSVTRGLYGKKGLFDKVKNREQGNEHTHNSHCIGVNLPH